MSVLDQFCQEKLVRLICMPLAGRDSDRRSASGHERAQPGPGWRHAHAGQRHRSLEIDHGRPVGVEDALTVLGQVGEQAVDGRLLDERGRGPERLQTGVRRAAQRRPHVFDVDTVDLPDLGHHQGHPLGVRKVHEHLVDGADATALQDLDTDQVSPDGADTAGDRAQRSGAVRYPNPHQVGRHAGEPTQPTLLSRFGIEKLTLGAACAHVCRPPGPPVSLGRPPGPPVPLGRPPGPP